MIKDTLIVLPSIKTLAVYIAESQNSCNSDCAFFPLTLLVLFHKTVLEELKPIVWFTLQTSEQPQSLIAVFQTSRSNQMLLI